MTPIFPGLRIESAELRIVRLPLLTPFVISTGTMTEKVFPLLTLRAEGLEQASPPGPGEECDTFEGDVHLLLKKLKKAGIGRVLVWDLSDRDLAVPVVRLVVPGLEGWRMHHYAPGRRGRACAEGRRKP